MSARIGFRGRIGGVEHTDPALFEQHARDLGYSRDGSRRASRVKIGAEIAVMINREKVRGQVWSRHPVRGMVWIALDNGQYGEWQVSTGHVTLTDAKNSQRFGSGRVAA